MEPKKNPKYDVHQKRGVLLNVGLIVSLILVITAFEWAIPLTHPGIELADKDSDEILVDYPVATQFNKAKAPETKRIPQRITLTPNIDEIEDGTEKEDPAVDFDNEAPGPDIPFGLNDLPIENPEPDTFRVVEKMPEPIGGWETFYKTLKKHIKYPKRAERVGAKGKVFVEFTVNNKGELSHFKIIKGIGHGCDEEASRVIALTKWTPGKQRGKPVNVKMVQPINFSFE